MNPGNESLKLEVQTDNRAVRGHVVAEIRLVVFVSERAVTDDQGKPSADLRSDAGQRLPRQFRVRPETADVAANGDKQPVGQMGLRAQADDRIDPGASPIFRTSRQNSRGQFGVQTQRGETETALQIQGEGLGVDDAVTEITGPEKLVGRGLQLAEKRSITRQPRRLSENLDVMKGLFILKICK